MSSNRLLFVTAAAALVAVAGCKSDSFQGSEARRYSCSRDGGLPSLDGGDSQCLAGWRCGLDGYCFNPVEAKPRGCDRTLEQKHPGTDCTQGWRCGLDGTCFDPGTATNRTCDRDTELAHPDTDCTQGWHCGLDGLCFNPDAGAPRRCDRPFERDAGGYDCAAGWHCSQEGLCFDTSLPGGRACVATDRNADGTPYDCAAGWHCGLDAVCFDPALGEPRRCERAAERDGGPVICAPGWHCSQEGLCFDTAIATGRACVAADHNADGSPYDCSPGWLCGPNNTCYDPSVPEVRACDRDAFLDAGVAVECAPGWRCGPDGLCYDSSTVVSRACDRATELAGGFHDCPSGWRCAAEGTCYLLADAGAHTCDRALDGSGAGSDCSPGWRCGSTGFCQDRAVGAAYPCAVDFDCEQGWRCNPLSSTCLLVTDSAPGARALPQFRHMSPLLANGTPSHATEGGAMAWPPSGPNYRTVYSSAFTADGRLTVMVASKDPWPTADGGISRGAVVSLPLPVPERDVAELATWRELTVVRFLDGGALFTSLDVPGQINGQQPLPTQLQPTPGSRAFPTAPPPPLSRIRGLPFDTQRGQGFPVPVYGVVASGTAVGVVGVDLPESPLWLETQGTCGTPPGASTVIDVAPMVSNGEPDVLVAVLRRDALELAELTSVNERSSWSSAPPASSCTFGPGTANDGGVWLREAYGSTPVLPFTAPQGYRADRLVVSTRQSLPALSVTATVAAVGLVFAPLDGGVERLVSTLNVFGKSPPTSGPASPREYWLPDQNNQFIWTAPVPACPGAGALLSLGVGLDTPSASLNPKAIVTATCAEGSLPSGSGSSSPPITVPSDHWDVASNETWVQKDGGIGRVKYNRTEEDLVPLGFFTRGQEGNQQVRSLVGPAGRRWTWTSPIASVATSSNYTPAMPLPAVLDRAPDAVVRIASGPGSVFETGLGLSTLSISQQTTFFEHPAGLVADPRDVNATVSLDVVGAVRGEPALLMLSSQVLDSRHFPLNGDKPQVLAQPASGTLTAPAMGELVQVGGRTWLYVASGDALWSGDVTAQLANQYMPPATLTRGFSPVPGVALRSLALVAQRDADGGTSSVVTGYVLAGASVYEFEGQPPYWSVAAVPTAIGAGSAIDLARSLDSQGKDVFRVAFDTGVLASLPAPVPLTAPVPLAPGQRVTRVTQLCGDTYALADPGLFLYGEGDGGLRADGGWRLVYPDAGTVLFPSGASFFLASPRGDVLEVTPAWDGGYPSCP